MPAFIAVHCGAGLHSRHKHSEYNKLCKRACRTAGDVLNNGGTALEAVKAAVIVLENNPLTNAGIGSNLTSAGKVENDAAVMDGKTLLYGGCGAIRKVKNPVALAYDICVKQMDALPLGLIPPSLLVGEGALMHAKTSGITVVKEGELVTQKSLRQYKKYKKLVDNPVVKDEKIALDTVGAVCVDKDGYVASACSSGGILLKRPGRVGQGALYASGVWADSFNIETESSVAVSTTGCGEHLVQTQLAKEISNDLKNCTCPVTTLYNSMTEKFINSRYLQKIQLKLGGALVLHVSNKGEGSVLWGHSTETMSVGFMDTPNGTPKSIVSQLPKGIPVGSKIVVGGTHFHLQS